MMQMLIKHWILEKYLKMKIHKNKTRGSARYRYPQTHTQLCHVSMFMFSAARDGAVWWMLISAVTPIWTEINPRPEFLKLSMCTKFANRDNRRRHNPCCSSVSCRMPLLSLPSQFIQVWNWPRILLVLAQWLFEHPMAWTAIEWLHERTEHLNIFLFPAHHSMVFYFRCSLYWWKGSVRF